MSQCAVVDYNPNKCDFSLRLNCPKLMSCRSSGGRSFQTLGPAAEKLLSPNLDFPRVKLASYGGRSFAYAGPSNLNSLPAYLRDAVVFLFHL